MMANPSVNNDVDVDDDSSSFNNEFMLTDLDFYLSFDDIFPNNPLQPGQPDPNTVLTRTLEPGHSPSSSLTAPDPVPDPDVTGYLNLPSPESNGSNHEPTNDNSQGSVSNVSESGGLTKSVTSMKKEEKISSVLKRKNECEESESVSKYQRSNFVAESVNVSGDDDEKRIARLIRNRESAHLSRQRKKQYVEELEDKVRTMHSTIQDLNNKIRYIMSENATLRSQMGGGGGGTVPPPPPGMYSVMYPWMPCPPAYMVKPQGSQVPLVPIPRLKPQATAPAPKKVECKKTEVKMKTKKVASVSFLGLLFFMILFGGLVPMVNMRYGGVGEPFRNEYSGKVLVVDGQMNASNSYPRNGKDYSGHCGQGQPNMNNVGDRYVNSSNSSEPLVASLYVPRNDKLVKIDGNLIIHSVLASEKAMTSHRSEDEKTSGETGLAVPGDLAPAIPGRHPHHYRSTGGDGKRALGSGDKEKAKSAVQQWFLEGVAGPMLSSGMCTEVFQFDVSSAIVPATTVRNVSVEQRENATHIKGRNRRILNGLSVPVSGGSHNISEEHAGRTGKKDDFPGNSSLSSMVVSVLVDPREAGDGDGEGMMGTKSISRIFVVVLIDSVKYVTYSCMLPFKGSVPLVTT